MNTLSFSQFSEKLRDDINSCRDHPFKGCTAEIREVRKLNYSYTGLCISAPDGKASVYVDLDDCFKKYLSGAGEDSIISTVKQMIVSNTDSLDTAWLGDYMQVKDQLFVRLSSSLVNPDFWLNAPHRIIGDMVLTYHILISSNDQYITNTMITGQIMEEYGVSEEKLHRDALESAQHLFPAITPDLGHELMSAAKGGNMADAIIITNQKFVNGASAVLYPGVLEKIAERLGNDFYVIPSSVHEMIAIPVKDNYEYVQNMLRQVNRTDSVGTDKLSDSLYWYDRKEKRFERCEDSMRFVSSTPA